MPLVGKTTGTVFDPHPSQLLGRGLEGAVYRLGPTCVKVLDTPLDDPAEEALEVVIRLGRSVDGFAWPEELLVNPHTNATAGFTLPFAEGDSLEALLDNRETANWDATTKIYIALDLARAVSNVHALTGPTIILGDTIKPGNVQVDGPTATFIDTGSVSVFGFRTIDGSLTDWVSDLSSPGYVPPEVLDNPSTVPSHAADLFALAVTLFEVVYGRHPAEPKPSPASAGLDPDEAVKDGLFFRYVRHPDFEPPTYDPVSVPRAIDALFRVAFLGRPDQRPPADVWVDALEDWQQNLLPPPPPPAPLPKPKRSWRPAFRWADSVLTALAVLAAAGVLGRWALADRHPDVQHVAPPPPVPLPKKEVGPPVFNEVFRDP